MTTAITVTKRSWLMSRRYHERIVVCTLCASLSSHDHQDAPEPVLPRAGTLGTPTDAEVVITPIVTLFEVDFFGDEKHLSEERVLEELLSDELSHHVHSHRVPPAAQLHCVAQLLCQQR